jgi:hypothetical protein
LALIRRSDGPGLGSPRYQGADRDDGRQHAAQGRRSEAYVEGSLVWVADQSTLTFPAAGELPFRFTGVLHREHRNWRFVQSHGLLGVANEESFGELLT